MRITPLIAKKKLSLNVNKVLVGLGQSWISDAEQVSWTGKLYNNGSVILAGAAQGDVDNLADSFVTRSVAPNQGELAGSYKLNPPVYTLGKDTVLVEEKLINYSDVVTRAFFQSAGLSGHLRNFASDVVGGVSTYEPISQKQWVSCPSVCDTFGVEFQPLFFQRSTCRGWFLMGLRHLVVLR